MKIEKISENQIRCTLNKSDLASRQLKISELAYGSEKARALFRDMMRQANYELGFEAEDLPLMIEAIPVSAECIILIITKVDNPEELDTRFSRFSDNDDEIEDEEYDSLDFNMFDDDEDEEEADLPKLSDELDDTNNSNDNKSNTDINDEIQELGSDLMDVFSQIKNYLDKKKVNPDLHTSDFVPFNQTSNNNTNSNKILGENNNDSSIVKGGSSDAKSITPPIVVRVFSFDSLDDASAAALIINPMYSDDSVLYKNLKDDRYYLTITKIRTTSINFNKICNILSEYGKKEAMSITGIEYFNEHADTLIKKHAVQILTTI